MHCARALATHEGEPAVTAMSGQLSRAQQGPRALYEVGQNTSRLLLATGDLITGWLLVRQSEVALAALAGETRRPSEGRPCRGRPALDQVT